jgi:hypothetical protein
MRRRQECFVFILFSLLFDLDLDLHLESKSTFLLRLSLFTILLWGGGEVRCRQYANGAAY